MFRLFHAAHAAKKNTTQTKNTAQTIKSTTQRRDTANLDRHSPFADSKCAKPSVPYSVTLNSRGKITSCKPITPAITYMATINYGEVSATSSAGSDRNTCNMM